MAFVDTSLHNLVKQMFPRKEFLQLLLQGGVGRILVTLLVYVGLHVIFGEGSLHVLERDFIL